MKPRLRSSRAVTTCVAVPLLMAACQAAPTSQAAAPSPAPAPAVMHEHFALARDLATFAMNGDLARLRVTAEELSTLEQTQDIPAGSEEGVEAMRAAARSAAAATTAEDAARGVADVAQACGACHTAAGTDLGSRFRDAAPMAPDRRGRHARTLSWINRLLWDGLVGPSDRTWRTGAGALAGPEGFPALDATYVPTDVVARAGEALRKLGADAVVAEGADARVRVLAGIWSTCADCHTEAGIR